VPADLTDDERNWIDQAVQAHPLVSELLALQPYGRASGFAALAAARQLVSLGTYRAVLVGGVDSLCSPEGIEQLIRADRILGPYCEGTIPGEAAVLALVTRSDDPAVNPVLAVQLEHVALRREQQPFTRNEQISSEALTAVFRTFREAGATRVNRIIAAHSGEGYFGRSFAHAYLRETEVMPEPLDLEQIADCTGDVGAAASLMGLALGTYLMARDARRGGGRALIYTESDGGETGAAIIAGRPTDWHRPNTLPHANMRG
jgi:3-oxoacyl-[acyl-carrier-protein] synthase-1